MLRDVSKLTDIRGPLMIKNASVFGIEVTGTVPLPGSTYASTLRDSSNLLLLKCILVREDHPHIIDG